MHRMTEEEKVALKLSALLSDLRHDIEKVGVYVARVGGRTVNHRLNLVNEVAQEEMEGHTRHDRTYRI